MQRDVLPAADVRAACVRLGVRTAAGLFGPAVVHCASLVRFATVLHSAAGMHGASVVHGASFVQRTSVLQRATLVQCASVVQRAAFVWLVSFVRQPVVHEPLRSPARYVTVTAIVGTALLAY